jgi:hypothetical protein
MTGKRFQIIHLGNPYDFVVKDHQTNRTYGTLQGDDKSLMELLNELSEENEQLKKQMNRLYNYFVDWHGDIMGANQFSEMWDDVKEDEDWEY